MSRRLQLLSVAVAALLAAPAAAQEIYGTPGAEMWQQGGFYAGGGYRSNFFRIPGFTSGTTAFLTSRILFGHNFERTNDFGGTGRIGYSLRDGSLPAWLGRNVRIELAGGYGVTGQTNSPPQTVTTNWTMVSVNGLIVVSDIDQATITSSAKVTQSAWQVLLRMTSDFDIWGEGVLLFSPSLAILGGNQDRKFSMYERFATTNASHTVTARLDTTEIGGQLGGRFTYRANWWLAFYAGGHVTLAHRNTNLNANDCFGAGVVCNGSVFVTSTSQSRSTFVAAPGGEIGAIFATGGPILLALAAGADYDYRNPGIRLPNFGDRAPASVVYGSTVVWNVQAKFIVKLN